MSIFGDIMGKIFHLGGAQPPAAPPQKPVSSAQPTSLAPKPAASAQAAPTQQAQPSQPVDVEKVLTELAAEKSGGGNWQTSIVDLLKLLDLDSSLTARKELGQELDIHAGADGSAEKNIALQKAVWKKLAENGGNVPASLQT